SATHDGKCPASARDGDVCKPSPADRYSCNFISYLIRRLDARKIVGAATFFTSCSGRRHDCSARLNVIPLTDVEDGTSASRRLRTRDQLPHLHHRLRVFRVFGEIAHLPRIGVVIVKLRAGVAAVPFGVPPAVRADAVTKEPATVCRADAAHHL